MNKKILTILIALAILIVPVTASAASTTKLNTKEAKIAAQKAKQDLKAKKLADKIAANQAKKALKIKQRETKLVTKWIKLGDSKINKDLAKLNYLIARTNNRANLAADTKAGIIADINTDIASLKTLKTKIDAGTDLATIKTDVASIMTIGSINGKYLPRINAKKLVTSTATATATTN
ncbi:MAG: hypothetical protein WCP93_03565 [Candidatus Berkelbacteria bacterium]